MSWVRLHILAEGETEENFANDVLKPHLEKFYINSHIQRIATKMKNYAPHRKGGISDYRKVRQHLTRIMQQDTSTNCYFTTMFDIYHMPSATEPDKSFPGYDNAMLELSRSNYSQCLNILETCLTIDLAQYVNNTHRLIPYFQLHEFEALIFANLEKLQAVYPVECSNDKLTILNQALADVGDDPEKVNHINGPAKRIKEQIEGFHKAIMGAMIAAEIGLPLLRQKCQNFNNWLTKLEQLNPQ